MQFGSDFVLTIKDEIFMIEKSIERLSEEIEGIDKTNQDYRFKYANLKSELEVLKQKLEKLILQLQEENKNGKYIPVEELKDTNQLIKRKTLK